MSAAAICGLLTATSTVLGACALCLSGVAGRIIGSAAIFGTRIGESGITAGLMPVGIITATPILVPIAVDGAAVGGVAGLGYGGYKLFKLTQKIHRTAQCEEALFTDQEATAIEKNASAGKQENYSKQH